MKTRFNLIETAIKHKQITLLITVVLVAVGIVALIIMPRQEFPDFTVRQGLIVAVMPGATSEEMEEQVAVPIENYLFGFKEVNKKKTYSQSKEGVSYIFVEINNNVDEPIDFWSKIKHGFNNLKSQLPSDLYGIYVNDDFGSTSAMLISLESETKSYKELQDIMKGLEARLRQNEAVSKLNRVGMQNEVINIYLQPEKMSYYGVKPMMIMMAFKSEGSLTYGGEVKNDVIEMPIHFSSKYNTVEDVGNQIIYNDPFGNVVRVKDIAVVKREMKEPDSYITNNRTKCLILSIEMLEGNNIVKFGGEVNDVIDQYTKELPSDVKITKIVNQADVVQSSIEYFLQEFGIAILSVILVTMLLLPFRISSVAATTIPIAILISTGVMYILGMQLDTVTLAALIASLGMVVDNSIVIIDNYVDKLDSGVKPMEAAIKSTVELILPVFSATLAILATFTPVAFFMTGVAQDFIGGFPIAIAIALGSSLVVSCFLVPYMCLVLIKQGLKKKESGEISKKKRKSILDIMQSVYDKSLDLAFRLPKTTIIVGILSVVVALLLIFNSEREMFPKMERDQFAVEIYLPEGTAFSKTDSIVKQMENILLKDNRVKNLASFIGSSSPRFHTLYAPNMPSKNYAQMVVNTPSNEVTLEMLDEYNKKYSNYFPEAYIRFKQLDFSASKAPIEVRISGDSIKVIKSIAEEISAIFRKDKDAVWVRNDYLEGKQSVYYDINSTEAARLGLTKMDLLTSFMIAQKGMPITKIWEGDYGVDVQLKKQKDRIDKDFELNNMYIPTILTSNFIPLRSIATPTPQWTEGQIVRRNGVRTITVLVDARRGVFPSTVLRRNLDKIESIKLPANISISYGGEAESEVEIYPQIFSSMIVGVIVVFFILLFQFKKIKTAVLIMLTIPLSLLGAAVGVAIMGYPFGFTAAFGILSLCGLVVRNGIILVDYGEKLIIEKGITTKEAALAAGKRRLRPIFLTSAAASVGVIPMMLGGSLLWGPFAAVVCFGLAFSMVLTLLVLPVLYWYFFRSRDNKLKETAIEGGLL